MSVKVLSMGAYNDACEFAALPQTYPQKSQQKIKKGGIALSVNTAQIFIDIQEDQITFFSLF